MYSKNYATIDTIDITVFFVALHFNYELIDSFLIS